MNKTYKVARSLSRGVVVTSEKASSRQGKVLKTVAAAVLSALAAGAVMATDVGDDITITNTGNFHKFEKAAFFYPPSASEPTPPASAPIRC